MLAAWEFLATVMVTTRAPEGSSPGSPRATRQPSEHNHQALPRGSDLTAQGGPTLHQVIHLNSTQTIQTLFICAFS